MMMHHMDCWQTQHGILNIPGILTSPYCLCSVVVDEETR